MSAKKEKYLPPSYDDKKILADKVNNVVGSGRFIAIQSVFLLAYILWNSLAPQGLKFDSFPFILLNLLLSFQAGYTGPFIVWSQNRAATRDRQVMAYIRDMVHSIKQDEDKNRRLENKIEKEIKVLKVSNDALNAKLDLILSKLQGGGGEQ